MLYSMLWIYKSVYTDSEKYVNSFGRQGQSNELKWKQGEKHILVKPGQLGPDIVKAL